MMTKALALLAWGQVQLSLALKVETPLMSVRESFGFIDEPDSQWILRKQIHLAQMRKEASLGEDDAWGESEGKVWFQVHHEPSFHCDLEERLGKAGDGGKWLCNPHTIRKNINAGNPCLVYSVGSHGQFDFEQSLKDSISPECEIHIFDPAPIGTWHVPANMSYHPFPLGTGVDMVQGVRTKSFGEIVQELGHAGRTIDIFKIDCEGCEWETYKQWLASGVEIRQILVELHWQHDARKANQFYKFLYERGYVVFNKEPNTLGCSGECVEYSFLKLDPAFR